MKSAWGVDNGVVSKGRRTLRLNRVVHDAQDAFSATKDAYDKGKKVQTKVKRT